MALNWRGPWSAGSTYQVDDVVFYVNASFVAVDINTDIPPTQLYIGQYWETFAIGQPGAQGQDGTQGVQGIQGIQGIQGVPGSRGATGQGFTWRNSYINTVVYNAYDCVAYTDGNSYICIADGVVGIAPGTNIAKWNILTAGSQNITFSGITGQLALTQIAQGGASSMDFLSWTGSAWTPVPAPSGGVSSFNGRVGAVTSQESDYDGIFALQGMGLPVAAINEVLVADTAHAVSTGWFIG